MIEIREVPGQSCWDSDKKAVFLCPCGKETTVMRRKVQNGNTKSCGCRRVKHRLTKHPLYGTWQQMMQRCYSKGRDDYHRYGGRGIKVCDRWHDIRNFVADMAPRPDGHTLDREDNDGDYGPENCRWATYKEQANNRRTAKSARWLTVDGETKTLAEWSRFSGVKYSTLKQRLYRGKTPQECIAR